MEYFPWCFWIIIFVFLYIFNYIMPSLVSVSFIALCRGILILIPYKHKESGGRVHHDLQCNKLY